MLKDFVSLLYPPCCLCCHVVLAPHEKTVCSVCEMELPHTHYEIIPENPIEQIFWGRIPIQAATACYYFSKEGRVQQLMHALKYNDQLEAGILLGKKLGILLKKSSRFQHITTIVPVPLHQKKLRKRGYNQCSFISQGLHETTNWEIDETSLLRVTYNESQTKKSRWARWKNVSTIFQLRPETDFTGKHILLIDDVITTGSTLEACAIELFKGNPASVSIATAAYTM